MFFLKHWVKLLNLETGEVREVLASSFRDACRRVRWPVERARQMGARPYIRPC